MANNDQSGSQLERQILRRGGISSGDGSGGQRWWCNSSSTKRLFLVKTRGKQNTCLSDFVLD